MAIAGIDPKCYILALFVRDDGVRFLLGDDPYEFKDKQLHFQPNTVANDVVEVQGNDGYLLAGQVRRPGTQSFDGYVCNGTNSKAEVEVKRREFLQFFRRSHFYKVIYVFPNGTAIQRKQGFLVDDPTVQELYQQYPEYHVALNFEDVNYYTYEEDDQGQEIYAKEAIVPLAGGGATGGLIWDEYGVVWEEPWSDLVSVSGSEIQINNEAGARAPIQDLELQGDTYQNGAPTPDAPIPVQTVTGEQTVTVTGDDEASQSYTINLDTIELCKIGNYQDYIYKSGDDWYVHKETGKASANGRTWEWASVGRYFTKTLYGNTYDNSKVNVISERFKGVARRLDPGAASYPYIVMSGDGNVGIRNPDITGSANISAFTTWLDSLNTSWYYVLATPTDTQITDATLVGQLEALGAMKLFIGENNLLVSATGTNLPATLEFSYPTKFAAIGAEWEEGGTKGATIVDVNAIDNTYPVWELMGPAVNPTISVLTTNTTLTYNGTITASQKLVIDMFNKTATLNGTSVIGNVSGDFVYMAPGTNRIAYTAENNDAPDSTIYWQEVVG